MANLPEKQVPGVHHRRVGDIIVTAVSDGFLDGSMAVLRNIKADEAARMLTEAFRPVPRRTSVNCFLIRAGNRTALVDCGCGPAMQASAGRLFENLAAACVSPGAVDTVLLTHMHPDHSNGLADGDGRARFPKATLIMHEAELAYWTDYAQAEIAAQSGRGVPYFATARAQLAPYGERTRTFHGGEVFPGVTAVHLPGHTPGHSGYRVVSGEHTLLIWGDIVHLPELQIPQPEVAMQFDVDPDTAIATRKAILERVAVERQLVAGMHLHFPGYAHVARHGEMFTLVPEPWRLDF
jgi:glyoxylase-like metal-dependent hydrolase (beta-lactamase superfamily II)